MFEKEAEERAKDYTENKERQVAYECGFLDGAEPREKKIKELEDRLTEAVMNAGRFILRISEKEEEIARLENQLTKAKNLIKKMLYEYLRLCVIKKETIAEAKQFLKE